MYRQALWDQSWAPQVCKLRHGEIGFNFFRTETNNTQQETFRMKKERGREGGEEGRELCQERSATEGIQVTGSHPLKPVASVSRSS